MKGIRFIPSPEGEGSSLPLYPNVIILEDSAALFLFAMPHRVEFEDRAFGSQQSQSFAGNNIYHNSIMKIKG
jgi:hypothetical protein